MDYGNGEYAAICRDPYQHCENIQLTKRDILLQKLDIGSFARMLAGALGIRWEDPVERADFAWAIGLSLRHESLNRPVFLFLVPWTERFVASLQRLLLKVPGPFVVIAPTCRHRTVEVQELLDDRGVSFLALEEHIQIDDAGMFVAVKPSGATSEIRPTPQNDRSRAVKEFLARHQCKVRDIHEVAAIHEADYYKWLKGSIPDHYSTCQAIEKVLITGIPKLRKRVSS